MPKSNKEVSRSRAKIRNQETTLETSALLNAELAPGLTPSFDALACEASVDNTLTYICKDCNRLETVISVTALREEEQRKLDQRLRDQQFYTRSLIESNIDALMTTDPSGIISDVNKQMELLTQCTRDELIGAPFKKFFTDPDRAEAGIKQVLNNNKVTNYELTARGRDGKETVVSYNATTFYDRDRNLQGVFAAARDITERQLLDMALRESNIALESAKSVAEKSNLAKSDFLSSMSHELRSPLNAILGFGQLMASSSPPPSPNQKESIDQILQAGWYLLDLINEILDLSLIESGKLSLSTEPMSLASVLDDCQAMIEPQAQKSGIHMRFPTCANPYYIQADRTRVKQVLINLLTNAIKYNSADGTVEVTCEANEAGLVRVSFRDNGEGLSADQLAQLFQPFNRLGQEVGTEEGTGIGLVVCKRLVELMGGSIGVTSTIGVGSVFWVEFIATDPPQFPTHTAELLQPAPLPTGSSQQTLLYVEDNPANLLLVEKLIARRSDIRLITATDGNRGVEIARSARPDVILMDINLPGISGIDAMKILTNDPATAKIPVVALSASAMPHDIARGMNVGFFGYLTKPIKVEQLMDTIDRALSCVTLPSAAPELEPVNWSTNEV